MNTLPMFSISLSQPADRQAKGPSDVKYTSRNTKGKAREARLDRRRSPSSPSLHRLTSATSSECTNDENIPSSNAKDSSTPASVTFPIIASLSATATRSKGGSEPAQHKLRRQTTAPIPTRSTMPTSRKLHPNESKLTHSRSSSISSTSTLALKPSIPVKWFTTTKAKQQTVTESNSVPAGTKPSQSFFPDPQHDLGTSTPASKRVSTNTKSDADIPNRSSPLTAPPPVPSKNKTEALVVQNPSYRPPSPGVTKRTVLPSIVKMARRRSYTISSTPTRTTPDPACGEKDGWRVENRHDPDGDAKASPRAPVSDNGDRPDSPEPRKGADDGEEGEDVDDTFSMSEEGTTEGGQGYLGLDGKSYSSRSQTSFETVSEAHNAAFRSTSSPDLHEHLRSSDDDRPFQMHSERVLVSSIFEVHHQSFSDNYRQQHFKVNEYYPEDYHREEFVRATSPTPQTRVEILENHTYKGSIEEANNWIGYWNRGSYQEVIQELRELTL